MRIFVRIKFFLTIVLLTFANLAHAQNLLYIDHPLAGKIWDMQSHSFIDEATLISRINFSNVLLLGEVHDNVVHHELQQKLLQARIDAGAKPALMMEQLDAASQPIVDQALAGIQSEDVLNNVTALIKFSDWQYYRPLLSIAVNNRLHIIAANVPNQYLQPVIWKGYEAYDQDELKRLDVETVWNEQRQNYLAANMGGAHCGKLRDDLRLGLTRSQRLRDALMADSAISSISQSVVGIVGSSHARRDIGLPLYFAARDPSARVFSIGFVEVADNTDPKAYNSDSATGEAPFDVMWFTPRMERENPCANFVQPKESRRMKRETDPYLTGDPDKK
jgi:uncharacterized iron-regulated protein